MSELPARPGRLNGLRHIALLVPNLEECERFYVDVLGMEVLNRANEDLVYLLIVRHKHTEIETHTLRETHTERHIHTERDTHAERHTHTH